MQIPKQIIAGLIANLSSLVAALAMGWSSSMIPVLTSSGPENPLPTIPSIEEVTWIGSSLAVAGIATPFFGGFLADKIGRKNTLLGTTVLFIISFLLMGINPTLTAILIARVLQGFGVGIFMTIQSMFVGEISTDETRGALGSFMNLFMSIGFLLMNSIGPFLPFSTVQLILLIFPCSFIALFTLMPETPYYYIAKDRREDAKKSLSYLRRNPGEQALIQELEKIEINVNASRTPEGSSVISELFRKPSNLHALTIGGVLIACQQMSGINGVFFYAATIFQDAGVSIDPNVAVIILCAVQLISSAITPFLADKWGRKPLLLFSTFFSAIFHVTFAVYKYGSEHDVQAISSLTWLPITALIGYLVAFSSGLASMPWAIISEIFPSNIKSFATAIMTCIAWISTFLVTKFFQPISLSLGSYTTFGIFAGFATLGFVFTLLVVFETKGLSLLEVQQRLRKNK